MTDLQLELLVARESLLMLAANGLYDSAVNDVMRVLKSDRSRWWAVVRMALAGHHAMVSRY